MLGQMESVLGADATVQSLCEDIVTHYEQNRANLLTGKAMIVAYSRPIAIKIYRKILELRPAWKEKVAVVMTGGNKDPEDWKDIVGTKAHKEELARRFKDNDDPLKIAIVVDMWLTGFDVPSLATMYVYKPMYGYNLMQAVARVNRVFKDKEGGLIVDYVGIASALKEAMRSIPPATGRSTAIWTSERPPTRNFRRNCRSAATCSMGTISVNSTRGRPWKRRRRSPAA